jgi:CMP-N,N'-diacetyllegionaminic acid synthase
LRILALVTARGGSKRVPGKNIRRLGEHPLIVWSITVATGLADICDVLVSTDDVNIAAIAREAGALVPWLRPAELATDTASSVDVCLHALEWYEREKGDVDGLLLLQPTCPFRSRHTVARGIELFRAGGGQRPVVGVSPADSHPMWCFRIEQKTLVPFIDCADRQSRSQDLAAAYVINGAFYLAAPADLRRLRTFISEQTLPLVMAEPRERVDIDTEWDWTMAQLMLTAQSARQ